MEIPALAPRPTDAEISAALGLLDEAIGDFPFVDPASKANLIGTLLTPFIRATLGGASPLALIDAPQQGTGKSLLTNVLALIATGYPAAMMAAPNNEEEWRKRITATLYSGATVIVIDNLGGRLDADPLASAVTSLIWRDRYLGASRIIEIPQRATWIVNGNNIRLGGDLQRRCYWIPPDAKLGKPWLGRKYKHPDLPGWVSDHRGELIGALLTLVKAWYVAGKPNPPTAILGGFEQWSKTVGGVLHKAGVSGFLGNLNELYEGAEEETNEWEQFLLALHTLFSGGEFKAGSVVEYLEAGRLRDQLPDSLEADFLNPGGDFAKKLGKAFSVRVNRRFGQSEARMQARDSREGKLWRVVLG